MRQVPNMQICASLRPYYVLGKSHTRLVPFVPVFLFLK